MTPLDMPEKIESNEYIDPNLRDLQTKIVDYRLELLLGGIKMIKREIEGTDVPYNRDAKMEDGIINIIILPKLRGESSRPARKEGIVAEKLFFDTAGNAVLEREIEGVIYKVIINNANGVGTMTLQKIGGTAPTETPAEEVTKTTEEKVEEPAAPDVTENKTDTLTWKGDLPEGATVRTDGPILIVEDKAGHEIGMFDMTGRDLSIRDQEYDGTFFGNIANPALYDLYVTNKGGKLLFEFEKRPFDETPFEKKIRGSAVPAGKEWTTYISNGEVGIVDINPGGRPVLIANLGVIDREKLHTTPREKTFFLPRGDIKVEAYYLEGKFEIEAMQLATKSYVPPVEKKEVVKELDKGSDDKVDASKEKNDTIPPVIDKKIEGLPGENVVDLAYGVRIKYGENGPEFGQYDMTVRTMDGKVLDQYYVDYYRQLTDERYFYIRRKEPTAIAIPFFKRKEFPNLPDLNRDDEMFALDIRIHELVDGGAWSYTDEEGDLWKVKVELDDKNILRVYVDAPLEKKKQKEEIRKKEEEKKLVINLPDEIVFPEFDNIRAKTAEQLEKIKQRLKDVFSDMYESDETTFDKKDITLIPPAMQVSIENETVAIKGISKHIYGLDPYTTEELENIHAIWLPKKGFKLRLVTSYFDKKLDKDLVEIALGKKVKKGEIIEKDGWKIKVDVDANGILIVSAAPPESQKEEVVKTDADIETRKLGFLWPTDEKRVNDRFGSRNGRHDGIDIATKVGSPIRAPHDGTIIFVGNGDGTRPGRGEMVVLEHSVGGKKYRTLFAHLLPSSTTSLKIGGRVKQGDVFAKTGGAKNAPGSGNSTGPHLHYEIRKYDPTYNEGVWKFRRPVDPLGFYDKNRQSVPLQQPTVTPQNAPTQTPVPSNSNNNSPVKPSPQINPGPISPWPFPDATPEKKMPPPTGPQQGPSSSSESTNNSNTPEVSPKVIGIPESNPLVKLGNEESKINSLLNVIKNFANSREADIPKGRQAGYENGKFVLLDGRGETLLDLSEMVYNPGSFTYNETKKTREGAEFKKKINGEEYAIKVVIRVFETPSKVMSVRMNLLSY